MNELSKLVKRAATRGDEPEYSELFEYCSDNGLSPRDFCNQFALILARGFMDGTLCYEFCDEAANYLFGFLTEPIFMEDAGGLPHPAFEIYQAFDGGEYCRTNDPTNANPVERYTRPHIAKYSVG